MTDELDTLRPEVREDFESFDELMNDGYQRPMGFDKHWSALRAELLRLANDNHRADVIRDSYMTQLTQTQLERGDAIQRLEKSEAELAALKARIAEAPTAQLIDQGRAVQQWCVRATDGSLLALPPALSGKRVRLVVEE